MIFIPNRETKTLVQTNRSKLLGDLWASFNLDLQKNLGAINVSPRLRLNTSSSDDGDFGLPVGFARFESQMFTIAGTRVFKSSSALPNATFTKDASTNAQTDYIADESDIKMFNNVLFTTTSDSVMSLSAASGGTWTSRATITGGTPHPLLNFKKYNRLYYATASDTIHSLNTSYTEATAGSSYAIDLANSLTSFITCLAATSDSVWIGTLSLTNEPFGSVIQWDGKSDEITAEYKLKGQGCMALVVKDDVPYAMDSNGVLNKFTGYSFEEVGRLPITNTHLINIDSLDNDRFIHPNGMAVTREGNILALVNNKHEDSGATVDENFPAGVWEWSEKNGFVHKYSISYNAVNSSETTDHGQFRISRVGAIANVNWANDDSTRNGTMMIGAEYHTNATESKYGLFIDDSNNTIEKYGYFVTTWISSQGIKDKWQKIVARYRQLLTSTDKITIKYRKREATPINITLTWVNKTSFTTTTDISDYSGYEVEILQGTGGGKCVHISSVSESGGTYTATIDEEVIGVTTGTAKARLQDWTKLFQISGQTDESSVLEIGDDSERIQIKCCMQFTGENELHELALINTPYQELK